MCLVATVPAWAACPALTNGIVPFTRFSPTGSGTVFTESTTTATATVEGAIAYDTTNDVLKVCDGTNWLDAGAGGGGGSQWVDGTAGAIYYNGGNVGIGTATPFSGMTVGPSLMLGETGSAASGGNLVVRGYASLGPLLQTGYGAVGSNYFLDSGNSLRRTVSDFSSALEFPSGGFVFKGAGNSAAGNSITFTELMRITYSGNVGIGTTTPSDALQVNRDSGGVDSPVAAFYGGGSSADQSYVRVGGSNLNYTILGHNNGAGGPGAYGFLSASGSGIGTKALAWDANGNVGIGTTDPDAKLVISGVGQSTANLSISANLGASLVLSDTNIAGASGSGGSLIFGGTGSGGNLGRYAAIKGLLGNSTSNSVGDLAFSTRNAVADATLTERMRITSAGNVGIGTTNPTLGTLQVSGAGTAKIVLEHTGGAELELHSSDGAGLPGIRTSPQTTALSIQDSGNVIMARASGNVGIGTAAPGSLLHVNGTIISGGPSGQGTININDTTGMLKGSAWTDGTNFLLSASGGSAGIVFRTQATNRAVVHQNGNVGIGTTDPKSLLHVASTGYAQFEKTFAGAPTAADCDNALEAGRVTYDTTGNIWYVCEGTGGWVNTGASASVAADSLDFDDFVDAMALDASTDIAVTGTNVLSITNTGTGNSFLVNDQASDGTPFVIDAAGNVGIGTSAPSTKLTLDAVGGTDGLRINEGVLTASHDFRIGGRQIRHTYQGLNDRLRLGDNAANGGAGYDGVSFSHGGNDIATVGSGIGAASARALGLYTSNATNLTERMRIDGNGNVGIGTTAPSYLLSLGGGAARTVGMERHTTANTAGNSLTVSSGGATSGATDKNGGDLVLSSGTATGTGSSKIEFKTHPAGLTGTADTTAVTAMTILGNGTVGIGTTAPNELLHIKSISGANAILRLDTTDTSGTYAASGVRFSNAGTNKLGLFYFLGGKLFDVYDYTASASRLTIDTSGNVGIGTTGPATKLDINGSTTFRGAVGLNDNPIYLRGTGAPSDNAHYIQYASGRIKIRSVNSPITLNEDGGGNVGIGTTDPKAKLDVAGEVRMASTGLACTGTTEGTQRYNATTKTIEFCNGSVWASFFSQAVQPNAFSFTDVTGASLGATLTSNAVTLGGFPGTLTATCSGCTAIARNGAWGGTVVNGFASGDTIAIRVTASGNHATAVTASAAVGGTTSGTWTVTTISNSGPNAFSFPNVTNATTSITYTSDAVTLAGFSGALSATCNDCTGIARNGVWGVSPLAGFVAGDTIAIRQTSPAGAGSTATAAVTLGSTTSGNWTVTTMSACAVGITVGQACPDGSLFAGFSPDGNVPMYTTPCDAGQALSGSCTGTRLTKTWNNGTTNWTVTGFTSALTGLANTAGLVALVDAGAPYDAAAYCDGLSAHGKTDWYLPAKNELAVLYTNRVALGGFDTGGGQWYWSASEINISLAWDQRFSDGSQASYGKNAGYYVRCVRR